MAILAPPDWQYSPRDPAMDKGPSQSNSSNTPPQQRPHQLPPAQPQSHPQQQQYPFQQQPQGTWTPSLQAAPFYPGAFYQNHPQAPQQPYPSPQNPYFDPANAQLAQWAYQQMMFNAQQHGHVPQQDFFAQPPGMHGQFNPFPSGTPPPRPNDAPQPQYAGFHPYRRPSRQQSSHSESSVQQQDWRPQPPYSRPDASGSSSSVDSQGRPRTNSNNSRSSARGSGSPSPVPAASTPPSSAPGPPPRIPHHRTSSGSSSQSAGSAQPASPASSSSSSAAKLARPSPLSQGTVTASSVPPRPSTTSRAERRISRDDSSLALSSISLLATRSEAAAASTPAAPPVKGSGLKGRLRRALSFNASVALREEVGGGEDGAEDDDPRDDDDSDTSIKASVVNPKAAAAASSSSSAAKPKTPALIASATRRPGGPTPPTSASTSTPTSGAQVPMPKKKSRAASLFNSRLNASTDNISLSSTVSSASVMIRKLGSMGRLARRNSLAGITALFKDKKKRGEGGDEEEEEQQDGIGQKGKEKERDKDKDKDKTKDKKKKGGKGEASEASVSHATAELEAGDWSVPEGAGGMSGLSPAAKLARQHTLKSNAEAAAKAREAAARNAAAASAASSATTNGVNGGGVPTWERNTATRSPGRRAGGVAVAEDGTRVFVEESESEDEGGYDDDAPPPQHVQQQQQQQQQQRWDDDEEDEDEEWGLLGGEEDDTIRLGDAGGVPGEEYDPEHEPWATDVRRSVERARVPAKGILKHAGTYDQAAYHPDAGAHNTNPTLRVRSNSYNSPPGGHELGPLARIPSPDPDHIDGLHRHNSHSSQTGGPAASFSTGPSTAASSFTPVTEKRSSVPSLPPFAFDDGGFDSPQATPTAATFAAASGAHAIFNHPALNSSAPALTTLGLGHPSGGPPPLAHRAATTPAKKLAFASNLSVYDTFSASMYDRRSEPATWSRLTPALAQRIKEELNSYKMEEMEVHAASRIHTQFFV